MKTHSVLPFYLVLCFFVIFNSALLNASPQSAQQKFDEELNALISEALVLFDRGKFEITENNSPILNKLAIMLKDKSFSKKTLSIHGHTDTTGVARGFNNQRLSEQRANSVYNYLLKECKVSAARITDVVGWGVKNPVDESRSKDSMNRSVRFFIDHHGEAFKIDNLIPKKFQDEIQKNGLSINRGNNPPMLEGEYEVRENELVYSSDGQFKPGQRFKDNLISFGYEVTDDNQIVIKYTSESGKTFKFSDNIRIIGEGDKFTAYFVAEGTKDNIFSKTANIISGEKTKDGIKDIKIGFIMIEKKNDSKNSLMNIGDQRIFKDSDGLSILRPVQSFTNNETHKSEVFNIE